MRACKTRRREQHEAFTVPIEAAGGINASYVDVIRQSLAAGSGLNLQATPNAC